MMSRSCSVARVLAAAMASGIVGTSPATSLVIWRQPQVVRWAQGMWGVWRDSQSDVQTIQTVQCKRPAACIALAHTHSASYRTLYRDLPADLATIDLADLPAADQAELDGAL